MIGNDVLNRPYSWGDNGRQTPLRQNPHTVRLVNNANGVPIYVHRADSGASENEAKWQGMLLAYDGNDALTSLTWRNSTDNYIFVYDSDATTAITGITQANPGVVTMAANPFTDGDVVIFESVGGMTELNFNGITNRMYIVANGTGTTFELTALDGSNVNTSGFGAYTTGGTVRAPEWANATYA